MRKQFLLVALIAVLATMATGCQKENFVELQSTFAETGAVRTVNYTLDGTLHQLTLYSDTEWDAFVDRMMTLSEQGIDVCFINETAASQTVSKKDTQTIVTTDTNEAKTWSKEKADEGYAVEIHQSGGVYECIATS